MKVKLPKTVENIVAKGEIARFQQFLHLPHCFQKSSAADASKCVCKWERVKYFCLCLYEGQNALLSVQQKSLLTFYSIPLQFCCKKVNYFATMFLTFFSNYTQTIVPYFLVDIFKVVCCRFAVYGKGLISESTISSWFKASTFN